MLIESSDYAATGHWSGGFDESSLRDFAKEVRARLRAPKVTLGLVFTKPTLFPQAAQALEILRLHAQVPLLAGCSSTGLIVGGQELEDQGDLVLGLYHLPGADVRGVHVTQAQLEEANGPGSWHFETAVRPEQTHGWLVFADPFHLDCEHWLQSWNEAYAGLPILGGLASGAPDSQLTQVYLNSEVWEEGAVALSFGGGVKLAGVISQGCTPIGETWTITKAEGNLIHQIGNRPAYKVLMDTFNQLPKEQQMRARGNLFVGLVVNEYQEEFHRGDFLVRSLLAGDPVSGILAVGARPRAGQSLRFQCRDAAAATEDLAALLARARSEIRGAKVLGGCLCSCNGRGRRLFGVANHDAALAQSHVGPLGLTGFFCNGEIGPVGPRSFLHGYTASLALFLRAEGAA